MAGKSEVRKSMSPWVLQEAGRNGIKTRLVGNLAYARMSAGGWFFSEGEAKK